MPIFRLDGTARSLYYAPGYLAAVEADRIPAFESDLSTGGSDNALTLELLRHAQTASQKRAEQFQRPFAPLCLTLYLNNECNLACAYCYSAPADPRQTGLRLSLADIRTAAELVAANCAAQNRVLTVVFHGGGEPTLSQSHLQAALTAVNEVAARYSLQTFKYIATNGVMSAAQAKWLAEHFDLIGLSCDGPADIQSRQRPLRNGRDSLPFVERTAQILRERGKPFRVRVTLTPASFTRQVEIAEYLCGTLQPREIEVEPVYQGGRASPMDGFAPELADSFVDEFFRARQVAQGYGVGWSFSGVRPAEIHGPYCHVFRDVLNLVPGGVVTACFKQVEIGKIRELGLNIGQRDAATGRFVLDGAQIEALRQRLSAEPEKCQTCINRFHCVRGCPDECPLESAQLAEFRCRVLRRMLEKQLWETAAGLETETGWAGKELVA
jgi:sulfatase maturation enzyme AslB (radical SAM superfamily)